MDKQEEILRNIAHRALKKLKIFSIEGEGIYQVNINTLKSFYLKEIGRELVNKSRKNRSEYLNGFIYLIKSDKNIVKVGYSNNPNKRIKILQIGCPDNLEIVQYFKGNRVLEKRLQKKLKLYHVRGEWFQYNQDVLNIVEDFKTTINTQM